MSSSIYWEGPSTLSYIHYPFLFLILRQGVSSIAQAEIMLVILLPQPSKGAEITDMGHYTQPLDRLKIFLNLFLVLGIDCWSLRLQGRQQHH